MLSPRNGPRSLRNPRPRATPRARCWKRACGEQAAWNRRSCARRLQRSKWRRRSANTKWIAPANHARRVEKALTLDADAVILDLEDAVAASEKESARKPIAEALSRTRKG